MRYPNVSIIILNWNGSEDTIKCLESIYQINYPNYNVILVDNASKDNSIRKIKDYCKGKLEFKSDFLEYNSKNKPLTISEYTEKEINSPEKIQNPTDLTIIKNSKNYGFAEGNNIGIKFALNKMNTNYILLLNNDTVVDKDFLGELVDIAEKRDHIGFCGPKSYYYDFEGRKDVINFAGGSLNILKGHSYSIGVNEIDNGQYDEIRTVEYVEGSCMLVKKEVLEKIGLLDTAYFAYWEETDWCIRAQNAGYKSVYVPKAKIWHKVSASVDSPTKVYYYSRNRFLFLKKNATTKQMFIFLIYFFVFYFWLRNAQFIYYKTPEKISPFLKGVNDGLIHRKYSVVNF